MYVMFKHFTTGEIKSLKVGFSWTTLFFAGFLGIPLWIRKLYGHAAICTAGWIGNLIIQIVYEGTRYGPDKKNLAAFIVFYSLVFLVYQIWLAFNANEMAGKNYLREGWKFADPSNSTTEYAIRAWRLSPPISTDTIRS